MLLHSTSSHTSSSSSRTRSYTPSHASVRAVVGIVLTVVMVLAVSGCELIVLQKNASSAKRVLPPAPLDQSSPEAVVRLFLAELDSGSVSGAAHIFSAEERLLTGTEKRDLYEDIARYKHIIGERKLTMIRADTLSPTKQRVRTELNYSKELTFTTVLFDADWFIAAIAATADSSVGGMSGAGAGIGSARMNK
jgi:hypothetical protein